MLGFSALGQQARGQYPAAITLVAVPITITAIWAKLLALEAAIAALPTASQNAAEVLAAGAARIIDGGITNAEKERLELAETIGIAIVPSGPGTYSFKGQDGTTTRVGGTIDSVGVRTPTIVNGAP